LLAQGLSDAAALDALDAEVAREMDATIDFTAAAASPAASSMFRDVFGPGEPEPEPLHVRLDRILAA
jgi:pyruvate dehydrogenase E1 component alpha subunit